MGIFNGTQAMLLERGVGAVQLRVLRARFLEEGGALVPGASLVITALDRPTTLPLLQPLPPDLRLVSINWLIGSLKARRLLPISSYLQREPGPPPAPTPAPELSFQLSLPGDTGPSSFALLTPAVVPTISEPSPSPAHAPAPSPSATPSQRPASAVTAEGFSLTLEEAGPGSFDELLLPLLHRSPAPARPPSPGAVRPQSPPSTPSLSRAPTSPSSPSSGRSPAKHRDNIKLLARWGLVDRAAPVSRPAPSPAPQVPMPVPVLEDGVMGRPVREAGFVCARSSKEQAAGLNEHITSVLAEMQRRYEGQGDHWRSYGYRKAISLLRGLPYQLTPANVAEAVLQPGIGPRLGLKIREIVETGRLRRLEAEQTDTRAATLDLFGSVWGIGPATAQRLYSQGFRRLDELSAPGAGLSHQQLTGLRYHAEFQRRIPRDECTALFSTFREVIAGIDPALMFELCGSFRRGKPDCGDLDFLVTSEQRMPEALLTQIVQALYARHMLTDDLALSPRSYMGVCQLPGGGLHRRIDIKTVPRAEWPFAILYFTGSDHFNRSMRLLARKKGYSLSEQSIVKRWNQGKNEVKGPPLPIRHEQEIFALLNIPYRPPDERDF